MKLLYRLCKHVIVNNVIVSGISIDLEDATKKTVVKNIQYLKVLTQEDEITALSWSEPAEINVLIGLACQKVKVYDTSFKSFTDSMDVKCGTGSIVGLSRYNG